MQEQDLKVKVERTVYRGWDGRQSPRELFEATLFMFDGIEWNFIESHFYETEPVAVRCGEIIKREFLNRRNGVYKYHYAEAI